MDQPLCRDCGDHHWGYIVCDEKAARMRPSPLQPPRYDAPGKVWGDKLLTLQNLGGGTLMRKREKARPTGHVTPDPRWPSRDGS